MSKHSLFLDSSALFAGVISANGASRALLLLAEAKLVTITISEQVLAETGRAIVRKVPRALANYRGALRATGLRIVQDPKPDQIETHKDIIAHEANVPIVVAAMQVKTDYLVTFKRRRFIDDPDVAAHSGLRIGTPGDALAWVREALSGT